MPVEVILPKLTTTMDEGTLAGWLKQEGDLVQAGQPLFELETDKTTMTVEAPASGTLSRIVVPVGSAVPIGTIVAWIAIDKNEAAAVPERESLVAAPGGQRVKASPLARRIAQEYGLDLLALSGSGPEGRIIEADVRAALEQRAVAEAAASTAAPRPGQRLVPVSPVRRLIAERLAASARTVARVTLTASVDATRLVDWRSRLKDQPRREPVPTYTDLILFLVARLLPEHPDLNARFEGEAIHWVEAVNIGIAVDTERGLLVPVVREADKKDLPALARETAGLIEKTRAGRASPEELSGGTFTLTNLGMYGIETFTPIINLPECAILGVGQIAPKPAVYQNEIVARQMLALSLAFDHRLVDGAPAARFLQALKALIEEPLLLFSGSGRDRL
jgi:pyruvate dehydrogenase E2 component (dihydrolipoamide acetyltransferase)